MLKFLLEKPVNVVCVGDAFVAPETIEAAIRSTNIHIAKLQTAMWGDQDKDAFAARQLKLERNGPDHVPCAEGLEDLMADCELLFVHFNPVSRKLLEKAPNLKAILTCRGGLEHIDLKACSERGIPVMNVIRNAIPVAEFTLGLMLALTRNIAQSHYHLIDGRWVKQFPNTGFTSTLMNLKVGLVGLGNIGIEVATRLKAMGVSMIAFDAYADPARLARNGLSDIQLLDTMEEVFEQADIVSLHLRLTPETEKIINKNCFSRMKPTSYFINSARGGLVDHDDLLDALRSRSIAGAALDVFDSEPLSEDSGFLHLDNVVITPHIAGQTEDAIPKAPYLLIRELNKALEQGTTERIVNYKDICKN